MKSIPDLTFLATVDVYQLPPIENSLNCLGGINNDPDEIDNYYRRAIAMMFPNRIVLKEIKRPGLNTGCASSKSSAAGAATAAG